MDKTSTSTLWRQRLSCFSLFSRRFRKYSESWILTQTLCGCKNWFDPFQDKLYKVTKPGRSFCLFSVTVSLDLLLFCYIPAFVVLGLVYSIATEVIGWEEYIHNDLFYVV